MGDARTRTHLGERIRQYRQLRGLSLRACAELAGVTAGWLSRVERGERAIDRRSHIEAIAAALQISTAELLGEPYTPGDRERLAAHARIEGIRAALIGTRIDNACGIEPWRPLVELERLVTDERVRLYRYGDVPAAAVDQADVLAELHAWVAAGDEAQREEALRILTVACVTASTTAKWLGYSELGWIAAIRAREAATLTGDPTLIGLAEMRVAMSTRPYDLALSIGERAIDELTDAAGDDSDRLQVLGMLHLMVGMDCAVTGRHGDVRSHLLEAAELAERTGDQNAFELYFGPTNLGVWRVSIAVEQGEPGRAREFSRGVRASELPGRCRQATFYQDLGRALAQDGRPREAAQALLQAERLNPVEIRNNALARGLAMDLLPRLPRTAGGVEVRALAQRMGIA